ncbi:unnamed protein product [Rotaria magnacalcarata]|uniref:Seven cysteines N-terminal domain-containing protein n=1 Tax=Rotaria magnacalcarata TaxID=392030 RepID=A0A816PHR9_9BILA|nr:unnamed protein product [Rotaria magnacalcarata]
MRLQAVLFHLLLIVQVDLRRYNNQSYHESINELDSLLNKYKPHANKEYYPDLPNNDQNLMESLQREKKYSSRKKVLSDNDNRDEQEKPLRRTHLSKSSNRSDLSNKSNRLAQTTTASYFDEASLCINEFDVKTEQLVKVKELKNGAHMIRFVRIDEPSTAHGLDIKDICMLNCCVEENCDLAMLSEQRTNDGFKCYLFACNGSCTYAPHQDYTSMMLTKDLPIIDDSSVTNKQSKTNEKTSAAASSSTLSGTCRSIEFSCRDGSCIPYYDVCNSYEDCPSGIDEAMCSTEFSLHQRTQQENRKKPAADADSDTNVDIDESEKQDKNVTSPFFYNIDLETQERVSRLQKLKEYLEETKGPEAWYHLFQTLVQHQQQDHSNIEPEQSEAISPNDDENFREHLLALEQRWLADRQKSSTTIATTATTRKPKVTNRRIITTTTTTTKRMKIVNDDDDDQRQRRPPTGNDDEITDDEDADDGDRYYWQPTDDDHRENQDNTRYQQRMKTITTTTRKPKTKYPQINRDTTSTTLLRANNLDIEKFSHTRSFLRESSVILLFLLGLSFTIILLVLVGFYCRDSWKHGRLIKSRSHDADYLINGLYL